MAPDVSNREARRIGREAARTLMRLQPRLETAFAEEDPIAKAEFESRLSVHFEALFAQLLQLYGDRYDFFFHLEQLLLEAGRSWFDRPAPLKELDRERLSDPLWFHSSEILGLVYYVDLMAGDLNGVKEKIPYFRELGVNYLHLMPLFLSPKPESDGGYAISDYRQVDPDLGTMDDLRSLAAELHSEGISLCLDFVFNHTSDEHPWALAAQRGDQDYADYYHIFPDRTLPDAYQKTLREIFPDVRPGSFTFREDLQSWVWTTFNSFQWDLNYANPDVFRAMAGEMLFLANAGTDILRLDALAFVWKRMGTDCENLPEAHALIQAFNALCRIAAPSLLFKSEAIVHPDEVVRYISLEECQLSYNPLFMALLWESLATRKVSLLRQSLSHRYHIPEGCSWVNYVRCHDDIGWTFDDGDAGAVGINGFDHRRFLNQFYTGRFPGSFARGLPFQENPRTGDARISGSLASLAGLEAALLDDDEVGIELSIRRILLLHALILSSGGIPLIYMGDEVGTLNDYSFGEDSARASDSRWVHRPAIDWTKMAKRSDRTTVEGRIYSGIKNLLRIRRQNALFAGSQMEVLELKNEHVLAFIRSGPAGRLLVLANFSDSEQQIDANELRIHGLSYAFHDLVGAKTMTLEHSVSLDPYMFLWLIVQ